MSATEIKPTSPPVKTANSINVLVYHGTYSKFDNFDMTKAKDGAHFFTHDQSHAESFGPAKAYIVSIQSAMEIDQNSLDEAWDREHPEGDQDHRYLLPRDFVEVFVVRAKAAGHDGLIIRDMGDRDIQTDMYLPFEPHQIKLATQSQIELMAEEGGLQPKDDSIEFTKHLALASEHHEMGFYFEEGGCWGMALALKDTIGAGAELVLRDDFVHAYVMKDGVLYDYQGEASPIPNPRIVNRLEFLLAAAVAGYKDEVLNDRCSALEVIATAIELAEKERQGQSCCAESMKA